jgi:hypothetical protein
VRRDCLKALIDADMLHYQAAFSAQFTPDATEEEPEPEEIILPFDAVATILDNLITDICEQVGATEHVLYLTGKGNFREEIAKKKPYKGNRKEKEKPFHYDNIKAYLIHSLGAVLVEGMEADDAMAIAQMENLLNVQYLSDHPEVCMGEVPTAGTIICTRDKDLLMVPGWHYGWECYNSPERSPHFVSEFGELIERPKKVQGNGLMFFYFQILTGDAVDNIPGCPGIGPKKALKALVGCETEMEMYQAVLGMYADKYCDEASDAFYVYAHVHSLDKELNDLDYERAAEDYAAEYIAEQLLEQARLVYMVRELDAEGKPIMWEVPK